MPSLMIKVKLLDKPLSRLKNACKGGCDTVFKASKTMGAKTVSGLKFVKRTVLPCPKCIDRNRHHERTKDTHCSCGRPIPSHLQLCPHNRLRSDCKKCS